MNVTLFVPLSPPDCSDSEEEDEADSRGLQPSPPAPVRGR